MIANVVITVAVNKHVMDRLMYAEEGAEIWNPHNIISDAIFYSVTGDDSTCNSLKINRLNGKCNSKSGFYSVRFALVTMCNRKMLTYSYIGLVR
jgi:hypothetical protein